MSKIALVTDSSCDLPVDLLEHWKIRVVPLRIIYREREYRDGVEITPQEVYARLGEEIPKTSMPSPEISNKHLKSCNRRDTLIV